MTGVVGAGAEPPKDTRSHWIITSPAGATYYTVTELKRLDEAEDATLFLISDGVDRYEASIVQSYWRQQNVKEIRDLRTKAFIRMTYRYPYKSKTRSETIAESKRAGKMEFDPAISVESSGGSRTAAESAWRREENLRAWRKELRAGADLSLLESLEQMRSGAFALNEMWVVCSQLVVQFLYGERCTNDTHAQLREAMPDCFFDAQFGTPCSAAQKIAVAAFTKSGEIPASY